MVKHRQFAQPTVGFWQLLTQLLNANLCYIKSKNRYNLPSCTLKDADLRLPDGGVDALEDGDGEGGGLARA
jgi:hypothetical protein